MINRLFLLLIAIIAGKQIVIGIDSYQSLSIVYFTLSFGIIVVAAILMLVSDVRIIENEYAALFATTLPLGFSLGLLAEFNRAVHLPYLSLLVVLFIGVVAYRMKGSDQKANRMQIALHGLSGMILFLYPVLLIFENAVTVNFLWISVGTGLVAVGGMSLGFLKSGHPILSKVTIYKVFPGIFLIMTVAYSLGIGSY